MTDIETINRLYRAERNKAAVDTTCKGFTIAVIGGFWLLLVALMLMEAGR